MTTSEFNVKSTNPTRKYEAALMLLTNMSKMHEIGNKGGGGVLLAGDPGVGKTSFMGFYSKLVGMSLITIEAPHIVEEHIINIPFIVSNAMGGTSHKSSKIKTRDDDPSTEKDEYSIELADSVLFSEIQRQKVIPDDKYIENIYNDKDLTSVYEALGGTKTEIPKAIKEARSKFYVILFLDEYWRQVSIKIRNMLRGILNGKIGLHNLPDHAYVAYASNLEDSGVETSKPLNSEFDQVDFAAPDKDEWFTYLINKFEKDENIKLNPTIINKFYELLSDEELNNKDAATDIRTSPRRWEQLLLYINAAFPIESYEEAELLITNVKVNFHDYDTGQHAEIYTKVLKATKELIKELSGIDYHGEGKEAHDWKDTLSHQIKMKMRLGEHRKYIPIISGLPGIGKTTHVEKAAADNNLRLIYIACDTFDSDDSTGIGLADRDKQTDNLRIKFSEPKLYKIIYDQIEEQDREYIADLKAEGTKEAKQKIKDYSNARWKYLIFFDELNRTTPKVFNALRRVILEKKFSDSKKLPDESIIIAAINPDDKGAAKLTDHMKDVTDILPTSPDWGKTKQYLENKIQSLALDNNDIRDITFNFVLSFAEKFKTHSKDRALNTREFYLDMGTEEVYISPREYTNLVISIAKRLNITIDIYLSKLNGVSTEDLSAKIDEINQNIRKDLYAQLSATLKWVLHKQGDPHGVSFLHDLKTWVLSSRDFDTNIFQKKAKVLSIEQILGAYFDNDGVNIDDEIEFINYINNTEPQQFRTDLLSFYRSKIDTSEEFIKYVIKTEKDLSVTIPHIGKALADRNKSTHVNQLIQFTFEILQTLVSKNVQNEYLEVLYKVIGADIYSFATGIIGEMFNKHRAALEDAGIDVNEEQQKSKQSATTVVVFLRSYKKMFGNGA